MSGTSYTVANQHDLLLAAAAIAAAGSGAHTISLANDLVLAGDVHIGEGAITIEGNGHSLTGPATLWFQGASPVVLDVANLTTGGLYSRNVELARPDAGGIGIISIGTGLLTIDGATMPSAPVDFGFYGTLDLRGVVTTAQLGTVDAGQGLHIPLAGGGSALLLLTFSTYQWGFNYLLQPDGRGGTLVQPTSAQVSESVSVIGAHNTVLNVPFADVLRAPLVQPALAPLISQVGQGIVAAVEVNPGDTVPATGAVEMIALSTGAYSMPGAGQQAAFVSTVPGAVSVAGGGNAAQVVLSGTGGLDFTAGAGAGSVIAGGGDNIVRIGAGMGSQSVSLGPGADTVLATGGDNTIDVGGGGGLVHLGAGANTLTTSGSGTIFGGAGQATITMTPPGGTLGAPLIYLGRGGSRLDGSGAATVVGWVGSDTIGTGSASRSLIFQEQGGMQAVLGGADTFVGGAGAATLTGGGGGALAFQGTGAMTFQPGPANGPAADTVVGAPGQSLLVQAPGFAQSDVVVLAYGAVTFGGAGDSGHATVVSAGPAVTATAPAGGGALLGGSAGGNLLDGGNATGQIALVAGGANDTIAAGAGTTYIRTATGAETVVGSTSQFRSGLSLTALLQGNATDLVMQHFDPAWDYLALYGFPAGEVAAALAGATTVGGSERLTLSDGTHITFEGFTGLTAANFL